MRRETDRTDANASGKRLEEERQRYAERRGAREACSNLAIDTTVRCRKRFRFDFGLTASRAFNPSRSTLPSMPFFRVLPFIQRSRRKRLGSLEAHGNGTLCSLRGSAF